MSTSTKFEALYCAHNYNPLPVTLARGILRVPLFLARPGVSAEFGSGLLACQGL